MTTPAVEQATPASAPLLLGAHWYRDDPGGLHRYLADLFGALRQAGLRPTAVVSGPAADAPFGVIAAGRFDRPFPVRLWGYCRGVNRAAAGGVQLVDAHFAFYALWPVVAGRLRRLPLVVHFQGPWADESRVAGQEGRWRIAAKRRVEISVYRRASRIVVLSAVFKALLVERYGVAPWLVEVIPPGIDLATFAPGSRADARAALDLDAGAQVVVSVRRLVPRMGIHVLIGAWGEIARERPGAVLLIVGDGEERDRLRGLADRLGVRSSVRFLGTVDEETLVRCYRAADVSVVPTVALEGFGLVVLESLACGTPAIVSDSGGLPEAVADLDPSLIVPAGDAAALAGRLRSLLDGTEPAPDPSQCRAHAETFAWPAIAERHRAVYDGAVNPGRRRLRVVFLDHCARLSGGELALLRLLPELDVDAHVILAETGPLVEKLRHAGISVEVLPIGGATGSLGRERVSPGGVPVSAIVETGTYIARLAARLRRLRPDLVHTNSLKSALYGGVAGRLASVPVVWHVRDRISPDYMPAAACRLVRAAARVLPTAVIANSRTTLSTLGRAGAGGVAVASPLGFPPFEVGPAPHTGALRVGILGRLDTWKGQHVFLDAFAKAFPDGGAHAVIVGTKLFGDDGYLDQLEHQVDTLGLAGRVEFRGFRDHIEEELAGLDVLVHASIIPEPFGQVVVEGMAADPARRRALGDAARRRAHDFTPVRIAPQVMAVYESLRRP